MPIHVGPQKFAQNVDAELAGEGETLFSLLATQVGKMSPSEQVAIVTALTGDGWKGLSPTLRRRFDEVANAFLEEGPPE